MDHISAEGIVNVDFHKSVHAPTVYCVEKVQLTIPGFSRTLRSQFEAGRQVKVEMQKQTLS